MLKCSGFWIFKKKTFIDLSPFAGYLCDMPHLTLTARLRAIGMLQGGATRADVANRFGVHRHTVWSLSLLFRMD